MSRPQHTQVPRAGLTQLRIKKLFTKTQQHVKKVNFLVRLKAWAESSAAQSFYKPAAGPAGFSFKGMLFS